MHLLSDIGFSIGHFNMLQQLFVHPWKILPVLAIVCLMLAATEWRQLLQWRLLAAIAVIMLAAWRVFDQSMDSMLVPAAILLTAAASFTAGAIDGTRRRTFPTFNVYVKPAWLAFMATVLASSLATALDLVYVVAFGSYGKMLAGWLGWAEISLMVLRQLLWSAASAGVFAALVFFVFMLARRQADGNGGYRRLGLY